MDRMRGGGRVYVSYKTLHALGMFCADVLCEVKNKTHHLVFILSQSFTIDYMSRDLWHYNGLP